VLQVQDLRFGFAGQWLPLPPQLQIPPGVTWLGGGEGRGKTSLLRLLAGDLRAPGSSLQLDGASLHAQPAAYLQQVAWMDPRNVAFDQVSATQFFETTAARYPDWDAALLADLAEGLGLAAHLEKPLYMLSTGSKRKVWLAAALASGARLTLLDEPFAALDKASIRCVLALLQEAAAHPRRAWVVADYEAPLDVPLAQTIDLGD
jgi:ABC-type multidrug transport system ATPase subunit